MSGQAILVHNTNNHNDIGTDPDLHSSTKEYANRFSGETGKWILQRQTESILKLIAPLEPKSILDVGGGHGQVICPLLRNGYHCKLYASSSNAMQMVRDLIDEMKLQCTFGSFERFAINDRSADVVVSLRIVSHMLDWRLFVSELCRVADKAVVIDFPTFRSLNILGAVMFPLKKLIEGNTRRYTTFWDSEIEQEFIKHGFQMTGEVRQFFWPLGVHRALKRANVSSILELIADLLGIRKIFGTPVVVRFERV